MERISAVRGFVAMLIGFLWLLPSVANADPHKLTCGKEKTIGEALHELKPGDTLLVSGTCNENVEIPAEVHRITLDGQGTATINGGPATDPGPDVVVIRGTGITIKGFTITGGRVGINVVRGGSATIDGNFIQNAGRNGVNNSSFATILNNTIQNNPQNGINVFDGSSVNIGFVGTPTDRIANPNIIQNNGTGISVSRSSVARIGFNTIENNKGRGIHVATNSHAQVGGLSDTGPSGNTIQGNGSDGVRVSRASHAEISGNTISENGTPGIFTAGISVTEGSSASLSGNIITQNTGAGVTVVSSTVAIGVTGSDTITRNGPNPDGNQGGVFGFLGSSVSIRNATINENTGRGVWLQGRSMGSIQGGSINNNTGFGIFLEFGSGLTLFFIPVTVTGNGGFDMFCSGAESSFVGITSGITNISPSCSGF